MQKSVGMVCFFFINFDTTNVCVFYVLYIRWYIIIVIAQNRYAHVVKRIKRYE